VSIVTRLPHNIVFRKLNSPEDATQCPVLFISRSEQAKREVILEVLGDRPVLTISEGSDFCKDGGMLCIAKDNGTLVFDVNFRDAQRAGLRPKSQLLRLARKVYGRP